MNTIRLRRVAENTKNEEEAKKAMRALREINPSYHWCHEWDSMVICDEDPEFDACMCTSFKRKKL